MFMLQTSKGKFTEANTREFVQTVGVAERDIGPDVREGCLAHFEENPFLEKNVNVISIQWKGELLNQKIQLFQQCFETSC